MPRKPSIGHVSLACPAGRPIEFRYYDAVQRKRVRKSSGTYDAREARALADQLEVELRTGKYGRAGDGISWEQFRRRYDDEELLLHHRDSGRQSANARLDIFAKIIRPAFLADAATLDTLLRFRADYAAGKASRFGKRSPYTVVSCMATVLAAFRWAHGIGIGPPVPELPRYKTPVKIKRKRSKGRPLTDEEFAAMLAAVPDVTGEAAADSYCYLLRGLVESGLRLDEAMHLSWNDRSEITPVWRKRGRPTLIFSGERQKNREDDEIPLLPDFERLLHETPPAERRGFVFRPASIQGRRLSPGRPRTEWVGKIIGRIGKAARIIIKAAVGKPPRGTRKRVRTRKYKPPTYASAHDLRRTCSDRLEAAGVDPRIIARVMRHQSYETTQQFYATGNTQRDAEQLHALLGKANDSL